jgi:hypothetical protein
MFPVMAFDETLRNRCAIAARSFSAISLFNTRLFLSESTLKSLRALLSYDVVQLCPAREGTKDKYSIRKRHSMKGHSTESLAISIGDAISIGGELDPFLARNGSGVTGEFAQPVLRKWRGLFFISRGHFPGNLRASEVPINLSMGLGCLIEFLQIVYK